jgi:ABC-type transport system involved in cytochrome bd biosynthesis fused ATPase/permease subunit
VTGAFQHLGQVIASALRITQIAEQEPEVTFSAGQTAVPEQVALTLEDVTFAMTNRRRTRWKVSIFLLTPASGLRSSAVPAAVNRRCCSC